MKQKRTSVFRGLTVVFTILCAFLIAASGVVQSYSAVINQALGIQTTRIVKDESAEKQDTNYFKAAYATAEDLYRAKAALVRQIGEEGTVLLKNDGLLPVSSGKITVLGGTHVFYAAAGLFAGGGMSENNLAVCLSLADALRLDGLTVSESEAELADSDAVLVVLGRAQGEGNDLPLDALSVTAEEQGWIDAAKASGKPIILLTSGDFHPDIAPLVKDMQIRAILHLGNAGFRGTLGLADVITGKASPSGRLVETIAVSPDAHPAMENFGNFTYEGAGKIMASQAKNYVVYAEGIYQDYRYFETRYEDVVLGQGHADSSKGVKAGSGAWRWENEVLYPFGFGLSYTAFTQEIVKKTEADGQIAVQVRVTNTGSVPGKEVVQLYAQQPYTDYDRENHVEKSAIQLVGFEKTGLLQPGDSETVTVSFPEYYLAAYDYTTAKTYILDVGDYYLALGNGAHDALNNVLAAKGKTLADGMTADGNAALTLLLHRDAFDGTGYAVSPYTGESVSNAFTDMDLNYWTEEAQSLVYLSRSDWDATYPVSVSIAANEKIRSALNDKKRYETGEWNDTKTRAEVRDVTFSADGNGEIPAITLKGVAYDDPLWEQVLDQMTVEEMSFMVANGRSSVPGAASVSFPETTGSDGPNGLNVHYVYQKIDPETGERTPMTAGLTVSDDITDRKDDISVLDANLYGSEPLTAATFNKELAFALGQLFGEDAFYTGSGFLWGLGANLHRTPYGGRASEYYAADPILTGLMGAAEVQGANDRGLVLVVKHFAANEQETNRIGVATFFNEQTMRELMLRAFEPIMTDGQAKAVMGTYNRIGLYSTIAEYDLMTQVLRKEWGSEAYVISDMCGPTAGLYDGNASIAAGTSILLNNGAFDSTDGNEVHTSLSPQSIQADPVLRTAVRDAVHRLLYAYVNSAAMNGQSSTDIIVTVTPWWQPTLQGLTIGITVLSGLFAMLYLFSVNRKKEV